LPTFRAKLFRYPGKGGWTFAPVPKRCAPPVTEGWGRTPVTVTMNGKHWDSSVWRDKSGQTLLPIPKKVRGDLGEGDTVEISIEPR